ncbi:glycosyltransferase [Evansella tamaricis]|uniref:Glycosyltransferase n=1 Tax=Evansella tamaricis TaxID=2069301 RepID=A0ABS6JHH3_9BACI|nr:glycosyltransferase [Evansella tamaricis]MBU9713082.1 glycosyltransferase [Evansella tamaricis]
MRILYVSEQVPFVQAENEQVRAYYQIKSLIETGVHVDCIFFHENFIYFLPGTDVIQKSFNQKNIKAQNRSGQKFHFIFSLLKGLPVTAARFSAPELRTMLNEVVESESYDLIQIQSKLVHNIRKTEGLPPIVIDYVEGECWSINKELDSCGHSFKKIILLDKLRRTKRYETKLQKKYPIGIAQSLRDRQRLHRINVVSNIFDFAISKGNNVIHSRKALVFYGSLKEKHAIEAAKMVVEDMFLPLKNEFQDLQCFIIGGEPPIEVEKLGETDGVTITGYVEDITPYLSNGEILIAPFTYGTGMLHHVLSAAKIGAPILLSKETNSNIGFNHGKEAVICNKREEYLSNARLILEDEKLLTKLSKNAAAFVLQKYNREIAIRSLLYTYESILKRNIKLEETNLIQTMEVVKVKQSTSTSSDYLSEKMVSNK